MIKTMFSSEIFYPAHVYLAQSARHYSKDQEVLGSIPSRGNIPSAEFYLLFTV